MTSYPYFPFIVTAENNVYDHLGVSAVGFDFSTASGYVRSIASALGGADSTTYFDAEYDFVTLQELGWVSLDASATSDEHNRWQIGGLWLVSDDGLTLDPLPFRPLVQQPDATESVFVTFVEPRIARDVNGSHINNFINEHGPCRVRVRMELEVFDTADPDTVGGDFLKLQELQLKANVLGADPAPVFTKTGATWSPGVDITADPLDSTPMRSAFVRLSETSSGDIVEEGLFVPVNEVISYKSYYVLQPGVQYTLDTWVNFDSRAGWPLQVYETETFTPVAATPAVVNDLTVTAADTYGVSLVMSPDYSTVRRQASEDAAADWLVLPNLYLSGALQAKEDWYSGFSQEVPDGVSIIDFPPLNTTVTYEGHYGVWSVVGAGVRTDVAMSNVSEPAAVSIASDFWVLTGVSESGSAAHLPLTGAMVTETRESTSQRLSGPSGAITLRGALSDPQFSVSKCRLRSTDEYVSLIEILEGPRILLRGPFGQTAHVVLIGSVSVKDSEAKTNFGDAAGDVGFLAPDAYLPDVSFNLALDTSWPSL